MRPGLPIPTLFQYKMSLNRDWAAVTLLEAQEEIARIVGVSRGERVRQWLGADDRVV